MIISTDTVVVCKGTRLSVLDSCHCDKVIFLREGLNLKDREGSLGICLLTALFGGREKRR